MPKVYVDCGFYQGNAYREYVDDTWKVYAFEPNNKREVPEFVIRKAVWIKDGKVKLYTKVKEDSIYIDSTRGAKGDMEVPAIDFSKFLSDKKVDVCSMDIEGAEFEVLEKLIKDNTAKNIKLLDVEFHHRFMPNKTKDDAQYLIDKLEGMGVEVKLKVPLE